MQEVYGFRPLHIAVVEGANIVGVLPLFQVPGLAGKKIVNIPFGFYADPLVANPSTLAFLIDHLKNYFKAENFTGVQIKTEEQWPENNFYKTQPNVISRLELAPSYEEVEVKFKKRFKQSLKQYAREAQESGMVLREMKDEKDLRVFYQLLSSVYKDRFFSLCQPYSFYRALWQEFKETGEVKFLIAEKDGKIIGGTVWLFWNQEAYYAWGASSKTDKEMKGLSLLLVEMIKKAVREGYKTVNFGISGASMEGLIFFKERWGAQTLPIYCYQLTDASSGNSKDIYSQKLGIRKILKYVPLKVVTTANQLLARYFA